MICGSGGSKSRLAKAAGAEASWPDQRWKIARRCGAKHISKSKVLKTGGLGPLLEVEMSKKCTPLWREATFPSQNVQSTPGPDHFSKLRCQKSARRCGAKHISKSKCTKHTRSGPLFEVAMSKKCTPLWREAHFEVKMYKTPGVRTTFGGSDVASLRFTTLHYTTLHSTTLHYMTLHYTPLTLQLQLHNYTPLHSTTLNYTTLHYTKLHYTPLHYTTLHHTKLHYTSPHYTALHSTTLQLHNYTPLH